MNFERVQELLLAVRDRSTPTFSGMGIIISDRHAGLPITPLRPVTTLETRTSTVDELLYISDQASQYHDGFHVLSSDLRIQLVSQYFSPPISTLTFPQDRIVGGRYAAALFGSTLTGVIATGLVSTNYGAAMFVAGAEVFTAAPQK